METNSKRNPHKRCRCAACRQGAGTRFGQSTHRAVNRKIRHSDKLKLRVDMYNYVDTILTTPPTD